MANKDTKEAEVVKGSIIKRDEEGISSFGIDRVSLPARTMHELIGEEISKLVKSVGSIEIDDHQKKILFAKFKEEDIEIRPDGIVYAPWVEFAGRLREAFDLGFSFIPESTEPKLGPDRTSIIWGWFLIINKVLMGFAWGEMEYKANNRIMSWTDACEGAKSNAIMRLCKGLGIGAEMWRPSFVKAYLKKYGERYWDPEAYNPKTGGKGRYLWRKKEANEEEGGSKEKKQKPKEKEPPKKDEKKKAAAGKQDELSFPDEEGDANEDRDKTAPWDKTTAEDKEKEKVIASIKKKIEDATFDLRDFKEFLSEIQKRPGVDLTIVQKNKGGKWSLHEGDIEALKKLDQFFNDWFKPQYLKLKMRKK